MSEPGDPEQILRACATLCIGILQIGRGRDLIFCANPQRNISRLP